MKWRVRKHPDAPVGHVRELHAEANGRTFVVNRSKGCWLACELGPRGGFKRGKWFDGPFGPSLARRWCEARAQK